MKKYFSWIQVLVIFIYLGTNATIGQTLFQRIETSSGLGQAEENNGVAVADFDGDFDLDIFVVAIAKDVNGQEKTHSKLYRNNGNGTYSDVTEGSGLENLLESNELDSSYDNFLGLKGYKFGAFWGDYDNDGDPDIFFTHLAKVQLFQNQGDGTFVNVTTQSGIVERNECNNTGATWFDYNNDGYLDLYIGDWKKCMSKTLYRNNGNGTFTNVTLSTNINPSTLLASYTSYPFDFNNDGWMDLYISNDLDDPNNLYINNSGNNFTDQAQNYGVDTSADDMGITIADYNKDGLFDVFVTAINKNFLLSNNGNQTYTDVSEGNGVDNTEWAWGTKFADFDLDGDEDLVVVNGFELFRGAEMNFYYENTYNNGGSSFLDTNNQGLAEVTISVEVLDFDYDHDGDLDLIITNSDGPSFFYENTLINQSGGSNLQWFQVKLEGTVSNRDAVGTVVTLTTNDDVYKRYYTGVGFLGQSIKPVHFGLNNATEITELKIEWPSGQVDMYEDLPLNTFIKAIENNGYEVVDVTAADKVEGCTDPNSCNYNPDAIIDDGSCTYLSTGNNSISGNTNPSYFSIESYSYPLSNNNTISWQVKGGEIIEGIGTSEISVEWGFEEVGEVTAVISDASCSSETIELEVNLNTDNLPENKSIARLWNEALLDAIRGDYARPTIHARNLFHTSVAMYDAWAIYSNEAEPYLMGNEVNGFSSVLSEFIPLEEVTTSRKKAISYAVYRLLSHRFQNSPNVISSQRKFDLLMSQLGYNINNTSIAYEAGDAAALGNFIAKTIIEYGNIDGSREQNDYSNSYYTPVNPPLAPILPGNSTITDPNRWQSLSLDVFIDQSGNLIVGSSIDFLSPEWGNVLPFALNEDVKTVYERNGNSYNVYHDPSAPPYLDASNTAMSDLYKLGFSQVAIWGSHLDPSDGVLWDISPNSIGNIPISSFPTSYEDYINFYNLTEGGDIGDGYQINPNTGISYEEQWVPRGDYARVLAEFWADGPESETPPGHWFTILNYVNDHSMFVKQFEGEGDVLDALEWDVKSYFIMGGAMHDAAISAWSIKGWYDYIRPISAIRYMAGLGQSTDVSLVNYHPQGIPLRTGFVEIVELGDALAGRDDEHVGKIKLYTWKGHNFINDTNTDQAGVGWILAENWWPYQRPSFVTPPFAGFVSGHSTYSRAAAEVMTLLTGDAYFPGGMGEFIAKKNEFLVFEEGPSMDVILQWATYRDASDQCSLSRIWGGIHPPADDIPGRLIGERIGKETFQFAKPYFKGKGENNSSMFEMILYPNPVGVLNDITISNTRLDDVFTLFDISGKLINSPQEYDSSTQSTKIIIGNLSSGVYILKNSDGKNWKVIIR